MNQLEMTYANFIESVCKMYNVPDAAEPLVKGYKALIESQNQLEWSDESIAPALTESVDWSTVFTAFNPLTVLLGYAGWKSIVGSIFSILGIRGENGRTKEILSIIKNKPDVVRENLTKRIESITQTPRNQLSKRVISMVCEQLAAEVASGAENTATHYYGDIPNAYNAYIYNDYRFKAMRTIPKLIYELFYFLVINDITTVNYVIEEIEKLMTWSGSWRRAMDDVRHHLAETWGRNQGKRDDLVSEENYAEKWAEDQMKSEQTASVDKEQNH